MTDLEKQAIIAKGYELVPSIKLDTKEYIIDSVNIDGEIVYKTSPEQKKYQQRLAIVKGKLRCPLLDTTKKVKDKFHPNGFYYVFDEKEAIPNFSTLKCLEYIFEPKIVKNLETKVVDNNGLTKIFKYDDISDAITSNLNGIHFNNADELKEYMLDTTRAYLDKLYWLDANQGQGYDYHNLEETFQRINPLPNLKLREYEYIDWDYVWSHMGHDDDYGLSTDIGLTGSWWAEAQKNNPDYAFKIAELKARIEKVDIKELHKKKFVYIVGILHETIKKINELKSISEPWVKFALKNNIENLKTNIKQLVLLCKSIPETKDKLVDDYLSKCHLTYKA